MSALNLLVLKARDPERLVSFYGKLGLSFVREQHGNGPVHHSSSDAGGATFEICPRQHNDDATTGTRIGFRVESVELTLAACSAPILREPSLTPWGKRAVIQDPEGHKVELVETTRT
jgi:lactoylglutathione lyase